MRRKPKQARSALRVGNILEAAETEIAERGYEAATLTGVAARAGTSIGSVYQYFPDKRAIAATLMERYSRESADMWCEFASRARGLAMPELVDGLLEVITVFVRNRPAYPSLAVGSTYLLHNIAETRRLYVALVELFCSYRASLAPGEAGQMVKLVLNILFRTHVESALDVRLRERDIDEELRVLLTAYFERRLGGP